MKDRVLRGFAPEDIENDYYPLEQKMPLLAAELNAKFTGSAKLEAAIRNTLKSRQKETPGPLNRKQSRKESRGQLAQVAAIVLARQTLSHAAGRLIGA